MAPQRPEATSDQDLERFISRRTLLRAGGGVLAFGAGTIILPHPSSGQEVATPAISEGSLYRPLETVASPEPQVAGSAVGEETIGPALAEVDPATTPGQAEFVALSTVLVGGGRIDPRRAAQYLVITAEDPAKAAALQVLLALDANTASAGDIATQIAAASPAARSLSQEILTFWYTGVVGDTPITDRGSFWFGMSAWQAIRYTPATSACKGFGVWATAPANG